MNCWSLIHGHPSGIQWSMTIAPIQALLPKNVHECALNGDAQERTIWIEKKTVGDMTKTNWVTS